MDDRDNFELPDWGPLVLAHASPALRQPLAAALSLDCRLERLIASASEPALGQLRLAWWREELLRERNASDPLPPDPLLARLLTTWSGHTATLASLIDGWENLVGDRPWDEEARSAFEDGRAALFSGIAVLAGLPPHSMDAGEHGRMWARAHLAAQGEIAELGVKLAALPRALRPLAVIGGLAKRSVERGGRPMLGDRLSPLVALRLGIFGT